VNPWLLAWRRFLRDRVGVVSAGIVLAFVALAAASAAGLVARHWSDEVGVSYAPPAFVQREISPEQAIAQAAPRQDYGIADPLAAELGEIYRNLSGSSVSDQKAPSLVFGADKWGRDVIQKVIKGTETSVVVGLAAAALATFLGTLFGALAGYRGGWVDDLFNWLYSVFTAIPYLLLVLAIGAVLGQRGIVTVILILGLTGWTGIFRLIRAEYLKHRVREYVLAADALGASDARRMFAHILPNVAHVVLVQLSLHVVLFIKSEVILSFLGFGVGVDTVSWGSMLSEAPSELILGMWWQIAAASAAMALAVTAFSLFTDAVRDALDPRLA
jgi:ABC-type dipeptide/oligopeptide/nickel transport system permease subunit